MWMNKRLVTVVIMAIWVGFVNGQPGINPSGTRAAENQPPAAYKFEDKLAFHRDLPVGVVAGTPEHPQLLEIKSIRFESTFANAWGVTARIGWLPVQDATWQLKVELLDEENQVLRHSRDDVIVFKGKSSGADDQTMRYADLDLGGMHTQGRRHATRFRIHLKPAEDQSAGIDSADIETHTIEILVVEGENQKPIADAVVVVNSFYTQDAHPPTQILYHTDSQGRCRITLARNGLRSLSINSQKQGFATMAKSWRNYGHFGIGEAPLVNLPKRHVLVMTRATSIGGIVRDTEGHGMGGAQVRISAYLQEPSGRISLRRSVRTDADGRWRVKGIPAEADRVSLGLIHPEYGGDNGGSRSLTGAALINARALKHVSTLTKGLTITGKVLDEQGQPINRATVMMVQASYAHLHTLTNRSGRFRLMCSDDGAAYREVPALVVEAPGYAPALQTLDLRADPAPLEFRLQRGRTIRCRVLDRQGRPIVGAWTVIKPLPENSHYSVWLNDTDEQGIFQVPNAPKNDVHLTVGKQDYIAVRDHVLAASEDEAVITMKRALRVHGTVTDAQTGKPIPYFEIASLYSVQDRTRTGNPVAFTNGTYKLTFDEEEPASRQLKVSAVGYEPVTSEEIKINEGQRVINFKLLRGPAFDEKTAGHARAQVKPMGPHRITGVVHDEKGQPVPNAVVSIRPRLATGTITDAAGKFRLRCRRKLAHGEETAYLLVRHRERNLAAASELDEDANNLDIKLTPGVVLSGKVVGEDGKAIPQATISLTFWVADFGYARREEINIDKHGHYEIRAVPSGYKYSVRAGAKGYGQQSVSIQTAEAAANRMELEPLVLAVANLSVSGVVVDVDGEPVADAQVNVSGRGQPDRWDIPTDKQGRFTVKGVCAGRLRLGANVRSNKRRLYGTVETEGGATDVKIVVREQGESRRYVPKKPPSLVGKALPQLKAVGVELSPAETADKMILVCFFDVNQRPSRHYIRELSEQAELLEQTGVKVVAVQAAKLEQGTLNEWIRKYGISFPIGIINKDVEKVRFRWSVESLPWLILTDRGHTVRANGFAFSELDEKMKEIIEK